MSDSRSRLPARPSLEQLQKQAKELLRQYRAAGSPRDAVLADAQFAIARQYGFETWAKLKYHAASFAPVYMSATPPFYTIDWRDNRISARGPQSEKDWDAI